MENSLENTSIGVLCGKIVSSRAANILSRDSLRNYYFSLKLFARNVLGDSIYGSV